MKTQPTKTGGRLLRPDNSIIADGKTVTVGPKDDSHQHEIKVNRSGKGSVDSIEVVCACGERIVIRCEYE